MNKDFIFYKGKYYTKDNIKNINYYNEWLNKNLEETRDRFDIFLKKQTKNTRLDILLYIFIGITGIKIGTLL